MATDNVKERFLNTLSQPPQTINNKQSVTVLVDVYVGIDGKAIETELSNPKKFSSFNQIALAKAKNDTYPVKTLKDKPLNYWLKNTQLDFTVSSMNTKIQPLSISSKN